MATEPEVKGIRTGGRNARVLRSIHQATIDELVENGYGGLTIEHVAARAGVHRTTIYRRWAGKPELVLDVLLVRTQDDLPIPHTGSLVQDLTEFGISLNAYLGQPHVRAIVAVTITSVGGFQELREKFWSYRLYEAQTMVIRAHDRGEISSENRASLVVDMMAGPIYMRRLIQEHPMSSSEVAELASRIVHSCSNTGTEKQG